MDSAARAVRKLMRSQRTAVLASRGLPDRLSETAANGADWPYASLVEVACDTDGQPILLLSRLAVHTQNIVRDARVSLLFDGTAGMAAPLTGSRVTYSGSAGESNDPRHRARFLARHPAAASYEGFADFAFWRLSAVGAHLVAGFGEITSLSADEILLDPAQTARFSEIEDDVVAHMNADHRDAVQLLARNILGREGDDWQVAACDPEGLDLLSAGDFARIEFENAAFDAQSVRNYVVELTRRARAAD